MTAGLSNKLFHRLLIWNCLVLSACIDDIRLNEVEGENFLIIEGLITNETEPYFIRLSNSESNNTDNISGANVRVIDQFGSTLNFFERSPGVYESDSLSAYQGRIGVTYTLSVTTIEGNEYISSPELMPAVPPINRLSFETRNEVVIADAGNEVRRRRLRVFLDTQTNENDPTYLRWDYRGVYIVNRPNRCVVCPQYCWVPDEIASSEANVLGVEKTGLTPVENIAVGFIPSDFKLDSLYLFWVKQYSLNARAFDFWKAIDDQNNNSGTIFDPPPGFIQGNIINVNNPDERVLGFFGASAVSSQRLQIQNNQISPEFFDAVLFPECNGEMLEDYCDDCTKFPNSQTEFPNDVWQ